MRTWMTFAALAVLLTPLSLSAQFWDGGGTTDNWTDANNWSTNAVPANNGTATPNFAGTVRLNPTLNVGVDLNGITFADNSGAFNLITLNGSVLTLRGAGITNNNPAVTQSVSPTVQVGTSQTWGGVGPLNVSGAIALGTHTVTLDSPANIGLGNVIAGSGKLVKNGTGALVLTGNNANFSGGVTLNSGILAVGINAGLGTGALTINGGTLEGTGGARSLANTVQINSDLGILTGTGINFTGAVTVNGSRTLTNNITNLAISGSLGKTTAESELTLAGTGNLTLSGTALNLGTSLRQNSGTLTATGLINSAGNSLTQNAGTFAGSLINRGTFVLNGGTHSGNISNEAGGHATINANLTVTAALINAGTLRVGSGRTLTFGTQTFNNTGNLELAGGTLASSGAATFVSSGVINGFGTISTNNNAFTNSGLLQVDGGNLTLASNQGFANSGTMTVPVGRQLIWNSGASFNNLGLVQLSGGGFTGSGPLFNAAGGEIRGNGAVGSSLTNAGGLIRATAGEALTIANLAGNNASGGELRVDDGATLKVQSAFGSSGSIVLAGANASLHLNSVTNTGTVRGSGRVTGIVVNSGTVRAEGGSLSFASADNSNTAAGRLEVSSLSQLFYTQGLATNSGLIALTGGAFDNNNLALANPGRIEGYGTLRTGGLANTGAISVAGELDVLGSVNHSGTVTTATGSTIRFFGPVSGAGNFTGTGTVTFLNTFAPGASPANVSFAGDVALDAASTLEIELGGNAPGAGYDRLTIAGDAAIGCTLDVALIDNFVPAIGSSFEILSAAGGITGTFSSSSLPTIAGRGWRLSYQATAVSLSVVLGGDYNDDGVVDAADYTRWRDSLGQTGAVLAADGNGNGQIDAGDYNVWKAGFLQAGDGASAAPVPEPHTFVLLAAAIIGWMPRRAPSKLG
jgi:autotransporter-associated beta strand protein